MKEKLRGLLYSLGADVCGFAPIERFAAAPAGFHPLDVYPGCKGVIVAGISLPRSVMLSKSCLVYTRYNSLITDRVDSLLLDAARQMERLGMVAVPLPCDSPVGYWAPAKREARGLISIRHAAVAAGCGSMGQNSLVINRDYGNLVCYGAILTDAAIEGDPLAPGLCIEGCNICISNCPGGAIDGQQVSQLRCRPHMSGDNGRDEQLTLCSRCRLDCPANLRAGFGRKKDDI